MTAMLSVPADTEFAFVRGLRGYVTAVASELGVGWESCALDLDDPVSAYVALDWRLPHLPDRDLALLWDERHGWAIAVETRSGEDLIVLRYLADDDVVPAPRAVTAFLASVRAGDDRTGRPDPPFVRAAGNHGELARRLADRAVYADL